MKITDAFLGEHGTLYAMLDYLEKAVEITPSIEVIRAYGGLLNAALLSHACIEDDLLFHSLDSVIGPMGPLTVMRHEHEIIEKHLAAIIQNKVETVDQARALLLEVIQVSREHFAKEEQILFPMAKQVLNPTLLKQLCLQWAERRRLSSQRYFEE